MFYSGDPNLRNLERRNLHARSHAFRAISVLIRSCVTWFRKSIVKEGTKAK